MIITITKSGITKATAIITIFIRYMYLCTWHAFLKVCVLICTVGTVTVGQCREGSMGVVGRDCSSPSTLVWSQMPPCRFHQWFWSSQCTGIWVLAEAVKKINASSEYNILDKKEEANPSLWHSDWHRREELISPRQNQLRSHSGVSGIPHPHHWHQVRSRNPKNYRCWKTSQSLCHRTGSTDPVAKICQMLWWLKNTRCCCSASELHVNSHDKMNLLWNEYKNMKIYELIYLFITILWNMHFRFCMLQFLVPFRGRKKLELCPFSTF